MSCGVLIDGSCSEGSGTSSGTLQETYDNSVPATIQLSMGNGPLIVQDTLGATIFSVDSTEVLVDTKLTVTGLIDPSGLVLTGQAAVPGGTPVLGNGTIWCSNTNPTNLFYTDNTGTDYQLTAAAGTDLQSTYNNSSPASILLDSTRGGLVLQDNPVPLAGNLLDVQNSLGSTIFSVNNTEVLVDTKLTVTGLIDPSGLVLTGQATVPGGTPALGNGTIWCSNTNPTNLMYTNNAGTEVPITASINTLTTKGDLLTRDTTGLVRFPLGSDGRVLTVNSGFSTGLTWNESRRYLSFGSVPVSTVSTSYTSIFRFIYQGSSSAGSLLSGSFVARQDTSSGTYSVRLQDVTNIQTMAEVTLLSNTADAITSFGTISNIPSGPAILEVQAKKTVTGSAIIGEGFLLPSNIVF